MNAIKSALAKVGLSSHDPSWIEWPPRTSADLPAAADVVTLNTVRPWDELKRQGLLDATASKSQPVGEVLSPQTRAGLRGVLESLEQAGIHLAEHRISSQSGRCSEFRVLSPERAVEWLAAQPAVFPQVPYVLAAGKQATPVFSLGDLQILDALHGPDGATSAPNPLLGSALRALSRAGYATVARSANSVMDPLQAYNEAEKRIPFPSPAGLSKNGEYHVIHNADDVIALAAFAGVGDLNTLAAPSLAKTLSDLDKAGWTFVKEDFDDPSWGRRDDVAHTYVTLLDRHARVTVHPPHGGLAFTADAATLSDAKLVAERAAEVDELYRTQVEPAMGDRRGESARVFDAAFYGFPGEAPRDTCRRLAQLASRSLGFAPVEWLSELHALPAEMGTIDEKVADYCLIRGSQRNDADARSALIALHTDVAGLASDAIPMATLHDAYLGVLAHVGDRTQARDAVELACLPVAGTTFDQRAQVLLDVASCYSAGAENDILADYLTVLHQGEPRQPLREASQQFATVYGALQGALKDSRRAHQAFLILGLPAREEPRSDRVAIMMRLLEQKGVAPVDAYRTLLTHRLANEELTDAAARFSTIHDVLTRFGRAERTIDVFRVVQDSLRAGGANCADDLLQRFSEAMVMSGDVDRGITALRNTTPITAGTVQLATNGQSVTIGGIRIDRNT